MVLNIAIRTLSFWSTEFSPYPFQHWNLYFIFSDIGIWMLTSQTLEFAPYS